MSEYKSVSIMKQSICGQQVHIVLVNYTNTVQSLSNKLSECKTIAEVNDVADELNQLRNKILDYRETIKDKFLSDEQKKDFIKMANEILDVVINLLK